MIDTQAVIRATTIVAERIANEATLFSELDSAAGDGDMGATIERGSAAVRSLLKSCGHDPTTSAGELLQSIGFEIARHAPSTMGTLIAASLCAGSQVLDQKVEPSVNYARFLDAAAARMSELGGATVGQKTALDALVPAAAAAQRATGAAFSTCLSAAASAAAEGAAETAGMSATTGRASWAPDRAKGTVDAGATLVARLLELVREAVQSDA